MKNFIIYNALGEILRTGRCADQDFNLQAQDGELIMEGTANDATQMIANDEVVDKPPAPPPVFDLQQAQSIKAQLMNSACQAQIFSGYDSDALGTTHHYPANDRDQSNMIASVTDSLNPENATTWTTSFWCEDVNGVWEFRPHTAQQIRKAGSDGKLAITAALENNALRQYQISQATTQEELDLILWE
jgi:hypothetical protein